MPAKPAESAVARLWRRSRKSATDHQAGRAPKHQWFNFTERYRLQFRTDLFDVINLPNFRNPETVRGRGDFGRIGGILLGSTGRQIRFALRLEF